MEIREYIRHKRRWLLPLVMLPVIAGVVAGLVLINQPVKNVAQILVQVPATYTTSDSQIGLYIARVNEALKLDDVQREIVAQSGIERRELRSVDVSRRGQSDQFTLSLTTTSNRERAPTFAETTVKVGTAWVAQQSARGSEEAIRAGQTVNEQAQQALFAYQDEIRNLDPTVTYATLGRQLLAAPGDRTLVAQQAALVPQVRRFNELKAAVQTANGQLGAAQAASARESAQVAAARSGQQLLQADVSTPSRVLPVIEDGAVAAVAAFLLTLGLSLLPDLFRRQRNSPTRSGTAGADTEPVRPATGVEDTEPEQAVPAEVVESLTAPEQTSSGRPVHAPSEPAPS